MNAPHPEGLTSWFEVATAFIGAGESIKVIAPLSEHWNLPIDQEFVSYASDSRLDRRYLVTSVERPSHREETFLRRMHGFGWQVMWVKAPPSMLGLIIDDREAYISAGGSTAFLLDDEAMVRNIVSHFDRIWTLGASQPGLEILHDEVLVTLGPQPLPTIQVATQAHWDRLIHELARHPADVYQLDPRRFEELVAELLQRDRPADSRHVHLTPPANDGGRDVLVYEETEFGRHLFLVECKRYAPDNPVDVGLVRQFYGVIEGERATAGMLVTSSYFTAPARQWPSDHSLTYRMSFRDYQGLVLWLEKHGRGAI